MNKIHKYSGFTLVEIIVVIAITGILASVIALFIKNPVTAYNQTVKRGELADQAYLIVKKIKQDVRMSLPNSVRTTTSGNKVYLELLSISNGGKYRSQMASGGTGDILDFTTADTSFDVLSGGMTFKGGERIVVANVGSPGYDAYSLNNMANYNGVLNSVVTNIVITSKLFPLESINENFYVVDKTVSYVCDKTAKTLTKYYGYAISSTQPNNDLAAPLLGANSSLISTNILDCSFIYNQGVNSRNGIVTIIVKLKNESQSATLYTDTYVRNF